MQPNSLAHTAGEGAACSEVLICTWEGGRELGSPWPYLYMCSFVCIYKNVYKHRKQNRTAHFTQFSPRQGANKQQMSTRSPCLQLEEHQIPRWGEPHRAQPLR